MDTYKQKEEFLELVASANLFIRKKPCSTIDIDCEKSRLERIAQKFYIKNNSDKEYNQFIISWLQEQMKEILCGNEFNHDAKIHDDYYELELDTFFRTKKRC